MADLEPERTSNKGGELKGGTYGYGLIVPCLAFFFSETFFLDVFRRDFKNQKSRYRILCKLQ